MWTLKRKPDIAIGSIEDPYLLRWYLIPRNKWCNLYLHKFLRSDDPRALHDHPWPWLSLIIKGAYWEHLPAPSGAAATQRFLRRAWRPRWGQPTALHRVELQPSTSVTGFRPVWTIFVTGPRVREWGFQCGSRWVDWRTFLGAAPNAPTSAGVDKGKGCG